MESWLNSSFVPNQGIPMSWALSAVGGAAKSWACSPFTGARNLSITITGLGVTSLSCLGYYWRTFDPFDGLQDWVVVHKTPQINAEEALRRLQLHYSGCQDEAEFTQAVEKICQGVDGNQLLNQFLTDQQWREELLDSAHKLAILLLEKVGTPDGTVQNGTITKGKEALKEAFKALKKQTEGLVTTPSTSQPEGGQLKLYLTTWLPLLFRAVDKEQDGKLPDWKAWNQEAFSIPQRSFLDRIWAIPGALVGLVWAPSGGGSTGEDGESWLESMKPSLKMLKTAL